MDLRVDMISRLRQGEKLTDLCREYGISRKTGSKYKKRFKELGVVGLEDQSRAPHVIPHKTPPELVELLVAERVRHPSWGPKKIKNVLEGRLGRGLPAPSTIGAILEARDLVAPRKQRPRYSPRPTGLREATAANDVWCIDYKGQFRLGDASYCYPLTLTDQYSRYIVGCEAMATISDEQARDACEEMFRTYGLPTVMRSDNGVPFASVGLAGLTKLSVYWLRLGIIPERTRPACPQDNGRHERMHRTLKAETTRPARQNLLQQQERFDDFVEEFNTQRPHEGLEMKRPAEVFQPSSKKHPARLEDPQYPTYDDALRVNHLGRIRLPGRNVYLATALAGELVGVREELDGRWLVSFSGLDLGHVDSNNKVVPIAQPALGA
jgi:putative transposase